MAAGFWGEGAVGTDVKVAELEDGRTFYFEEDVEPTGALQNVGIADLGGQLEYGEALDAVKAAAEAMLAKLAGLAQAPSGIEISFGIKLSTAVGAIIAKAGGEANFSVKLSWSNK